MILVVHAQLSIKKTDNKITPDTGQLSTQLELVCYRTRKLLDAYHSAVMNTRC